VLRLSIGARLVIRKDAQREAGNKSGPPPLFSPDRRRGGPAGRERRQASSSVFFCLPCLLSPAPWPLRRVMRK
jgi:hypothetical protein